MISNDIFRAHLEKADFKRLSTFIYGELGIRMPEEKRFMLQMRLQKRLAALNIPSFREYIDYVFSHEGERGELSNMIDLVTTNKTEFFRESNHFDFLSLEALPKLINSGRRQIKVWSAGCSSGEEPYTLAMVLNEFSSQNPGFDYSILGTDLSSRMLKQAVLAVYTKERVANMNMNLIRRYFLKSKDASKKTVRVCPELRSKVSFMRLNLMDGYYNVNEMFDLIFCRNVLIYFDRDTQEKVINRLCTHLKPEGFFFLGHSESITNLNVPLKQLRPTIFTKA